MAQSVGPVTGGLTCDGSTVGARHRSGTHYHSLTLSTAASPLFLSIRRPPLHRRLDLSTVLLAAALSTAASTSPPPPRRHLHHRRLNLSAILSSAISAALFAAISALSAALAASLSTAVSAALSTALYALSADPDPDLPDAGQHRRPSRPSSSPRPRPPKTTPVSTTPATAPPTRYDAPLILNMI
uniref:Uncharacterized protein n=1 Tax=Oryza sativa subsp. japonica TaxID=39947 RepID=Q6Z3U7_ORYSJ|nr:hypothetical protein [Oryza sativa Japonica Group]